MLVEKQVKMEAGHPCMQVRQLVVIGEEGTISPEITEQMCQSVVILITQSCMRIRYALSYCFLHVGR